MVSEARRSPHNSRSCEAETTITVMVTVTVRLFFDDKNREKKLPGGIIVIKKTTGKEKHRKQAQKKARCNLVSLLASCCSYRMYEFGQYNCSCDRGKYNNPQLDHIPKMNHSLKMVAPALIFTGTCITTKPSDIACKLGPLCGGISS
jgi:hypothetical protein